MRQFTKYKMEDYSNWKLEIMKNLDYRDVEQSKLLDKWIEENETLFEKVSKAHIRTIISWFKLAFILMFIMIFYDIVTDNTPYKLFLGILSALSFLIATIKLGRYWLKYDNVFL